MAVKLVTNNGQTITLNRSFRVRGLPLERDVPSLTIEGRDGEYVHEKNIRLRPRTITVTGFIYANSADEAKKQFDELANILNKEEALKLYEDDTENRYINVRYTNITHDYEEGTNRKVARVTITFTAYDPHMYGDEVIVEHVVSTDTVRVEAEDPKGYSIRYVGPWTKLTDTNYSGSASMQVDQAGAYVEVTFYGSGISYVFARLPDSGIVLASIDDGTPETIDLYAATAAYQQVQTWSGLTPGKHTLKLMCTGTKNAASTGTRIIVDAFDVIGSAVLTVDNQGTADVEPVIFVQPQERERVFSFVGKAAGQTAVPHTAHTSTGTSLPTDTTSGTEFSQEDYDKLFAADSAAASTTTSAASQYPIQRFSFDLKNTLGGDVNRIRSNSKLSGVWRGKANGRNSGADDYQAEIYAWNRTTNKYDKLTEGGVSSIMPVPFTISDTSKYVDDQGRVHILVRSKYPSDGTVAAEVATDYVELRAAQSATKPIIVNKHKNLLLNAGFENGFDQWYTVSAQLDSINALEGNYCTTSTQGGVGFVRQYVYDVEPGAFYCLSGFVKIIGGDPIGSFMQLNQYDASGALITARNARRLTKTNVWQRIHYVWQLSPNCVYVVVQFGYLSNYGIQQMLVDNVQFEKVTGVDDVPTHWEDTAPQRIEINTELVSGDVVKLEPGERKALLNGSNILSNLNTQYKVHGFKLNPGKNTLVFDEEPGGSGLYKVTLKYRPRYY